MFRYLFPIEITPWFCCSPTPFIAIVCIKSVSLLNEKKKFYWGLEILKQLSDIFSEIHILCSKEALGQRQYIPNKAILLEFLWLN